MGGSDMKKRIIAILFTLALTLGHAVVALVDTASLPLAGKALGPLPLAGHFFRRGDTMGPNHILKAYLCTVGLAAAAATYRLGIGTTNRFHVDLLVILLLLLANNRRSIQTESGTFSPQLSLAAPRYGLSRTFDGCSDSSPGSNRAG